MKKLSMKKGSMKTEDILMIIIVVLIVVIVIYWIYNSMNKKNVEKFTGCNGGVMKGGQCIGGISNSQKKKLDDIKKMTKEAYMKAYNIGEDKYNKAINAANSAWNDTVNFFKSL